MKKQQDNKRPARSPANTASTWLKRSGAIFLVLLSALILTLLTAVFVFERGPSPTARRVFVMSVNETSALKWVANIFLSAAQVNDILGNDDSTLSSDDQSYTDTSLINIPTPKPPSEIPGSPEYRPAEGTGSEPLPGTEGSSGTQRGDGLELFDIKGKGYIGYMLVVDDPKRIILGTPDSFGDEGLELMKMIRKYGAVAGINGGGFHDPGGVGTGGQPYGFVIVDGEFMYGRNYNGNIIGFDSKGIFHTGNMSASTAIELGIQHACTFGPVLISNGIPANLEGLTSGINPRTAIGQRADGAVLMLVIDGRQLGSLGATYEDLVEIMLDYGAVNAANLDGGSSTEMIIYEERINNVAIMWPRKLPTAFLVKDIP